MLELREAVVENVKRVKIARLTVGDDKFVEISGKNGSGKSSLMDAIAFALVGKKGLPDVPVRDGEEAGRVRLDLGEIVVKWRVTADRKVGLSVESADGNTFPSPQAILDSIRGELAFDPVAFCRMKPREQYDQLRKIAKLPIDLDEHDADTEELFNRRTIINRQAKDLASQVAGIKVAFDCPREPIDTAALMQELRSIDTHNRYADKCVQAVKAKEIECFTADREVAKLTVALKIAQGTAAALHAELSQMPDVPARIDPATVHDKLGSAATVNAQVAERRRRENLAAKQHATEDEAAALTKQIDDRRRERSEAIATAEMPIPGLGFGDGIVTYDGVPLSQASSSEQIRVGVAVAMAANPKLRLVMIRDASLLDEITLDAIRRQTRDGDYTVLVERVDTSGTVGVYMEDGEVRADNRALTTYLQALAILDDAIAGE